MVGLVDRVNFAILRYKYPESMVELVPLDRVNLAVMRSKYPGSMIGLADGVNLAICCACPISGLPVHRIDRWKFDRGGILYFCTYPNFS